MATKKTIWQNLGSILTPNIDYERIKNEPINFNDNTKKQLTPDEFLANELERQQSAFLKNQWKKNVNYSMRHEYNQQTYSGRLLAYQDYEAMEFYPIISSALTLLAEEATLSNDEGNVLKIESNDERIKKELEYLFYDIIDINTNMYFWTRQTIKYGDTFIYIMGLPDKGIMNVRQQPPIQIERYEKEEDGKYLLNFKRNDTSSEFSVFQMLHFRLLEDDKFIPYGSSVLNKVRRTFRQLVMAEDAMLTYRIERASERRVFKIYVGNIDEDDVKPYIENIASHFKKQPSINQDAGSIDYRYNSMTVSEDYFIPIRDGQSGTVIDTLPGASNLDQISDIEYLRNNLFTGLGIPKPLLSFDEQIGEGKSLTMMDIRLAKKVNRIQKNMLAELNKLALIHLILKGYDDADVMKFRLSMTNPSPQLELLKIEVLNQKADLFDKLVKNDNGISIMSHTNAKKELFGWNNDEIREDLQQQKFEIAVKNELEKAVENKEIITGIFTKTDKILGIKHDKKEEGSEEAGGDMGGEEAGGDMGADMGGEDAGGDIGGDLSNLDNETES